MGREKGKDTTAVQQYLRDLGVLKLTTKQTAGGEVDKSQRDTGLTQQDDAARQPAYGSPDCKLKHEAAGKRDGDRYVYFSATYDGCSKCVRWFVEVCGVDAGVMSDSGTFNAFSRACYGADNGRDTAEVRGYLQGRGVEELTRPESKRNRQRENDGATMPKLS